MENYAGGSLRALERQWFKDMSGIRVGPARMRQVRMKESKIMNRFPFKHVHLIVTYACAHSKIKYYYDIIQSQLYH